MTNDLTIPLEIKSCYSADIESVWAWHPANRAEVYFQLSIDIGQRHSPAATTFQTVVATPEGLRATFDKYGTAAIAERNLVVISEYAWETVIDRLQRIVRVCESSTLDESFLKLSRFFFWEFEDFQREEEIQ